MLRLSIPVNDAPACLPLSPVEDWSRLRRGAFLNKCVSIGFGSAGKTLIGLKIFKTGRKFFAYKNQG